MLRNGEREELRVCLLTFVGFSASPLNGEAALLWDRDQVAYKAKVLARHLEPAELEEIMGGQVGV